LTQRLAEGTRILVVDDEMGMREGCRRALTPAGYKVDLAPDLARARELIAEGDYDLYLLDVMLPDGSGLGLLGSILGQNPDAICIIITGFGSVEMAVDAVRQGAYNFLSKPFTSDELLVAVEQGLERHRLKAVERQAEELYRTKEELERLDEVKSHLMLKVAHELRAPAAAAQSYVNLIIAGYVPANEITPTLSRIQARLQEMLNLTSDLLELARLKEARGLPAQTGEQDVASILKEVYEMLSEQARNKSQSFQIEILDHPIMVANREHIKQIWTNLISNAIKYTPERGRIAVRLQMDQDVLIGVVEDSGIGMSEQEMEHLFQEFFRTDAAKATGEIGTGLGLSIVKQIIDSYGGEIKATSKVGQGTRFRFTLPLQPKLERSEPLAGARPQSAPTPGAPRVYRGTHAANLVRGGGAGPETRR
jgi:two-component system sensor histidine kinase/response regulator